MAVKPGHGHHQADRSFYESFVDASLALADCGRAPGPARIIAYCPQVLRNPFQKMLYARAFEHGFATVSVPAPSELRTVPGDFKPVLHLHWLHNVFARAATAIDARTAARNFLGNVGHLKDAGSQVVWTVHNVMSHAVRFPEEEVAFRAEIARLADHIHVMNPATVDLARPCYDIDAEKTFHVPHPSYIGVYANYMSREAARLAFGFGPDDKVFLLFGALGQQKGTLNFLRGLDALQQKLEGRARILVAGAPGDAALTADVSEIATLRPDVWLDAVHVPGQLIQQYFKAADVVVCPYAAGLNSGVIATAATFGKPVVAPSTMICGGDNPQPGAFGFAMGDLAECYDACVDAAASRPPTDAMQDWAEEHAPRHVSSRFFQMLEARL